MINLKFDNEAQAIAVLSAHGIAATDREGVTVMPRTVFIDGVRVDVIAHGVISATTGRMIDGPSVGGVTGSPVAEVAPLPGYHVTVVWGGDNPPEFPPNYADGPVAIVSAVDCAPQLVDTSITWLDFLDLFSFQERVQVASSNDLYVAYFRLVATGLGGDMHINDPRVAQGLDALIAAGLINAERKAKVLARVAP